jgi:outer membrane protein OmpA-like peptidoglycan-associated protein
VEITSSAPELLRLVEVEEVQREATPPIVEIDLKMTAGMGWKQWTFEASQFDEEQSDMVLKTATDAARGDFNAMIVPPPYIRWNLMAHPDSTPRATAPISLKLEGYDRLNRQSTSRLVEIPVKATPAQTPDSVTLRAVEYVLYAFDYRTGSLNERDPATAQIVNRIGTATAGAREITVTGYTDSRGSAAANETLSLERANSVALVLGLQRSARIEGKGISTLYDNQLPEGRLYNRRVVVRIE